MHSTVDEIRTLDDLRRFIHQTLCAKENLLANEFAISEVRLTQGGQCCGIQFSVRGPRSVRLAAIWAIDRNAIYLYDTKGQRYAKINLPREVPLASHAPAA